MTRDWRGILAGVALVVVSGGDALAAGPAVAPPPVAPGSSKAVPDDAAALAARIDRLTAELVALRTELSRVMAQGQQHDAQLRALQARLEQLLTGGVPKGFAPSGADPSLSRLSPRIDRPEDVYEGGVRQAEAGELDAALLIFYELITNHPTHPLREEAQFRIGDILYTQNHLAEALKEFGEVVTVRTSGARVPDALLKMGLCHQRLGRDQLARHVWERLIREYPRTEAARQARPLLARVTRSPGR